MSDISKLKRRKILLLMKQKRRKPFFQDEPIGVNWEKAPSLKVATKFVVERQPVSLRIPKLCIGEITPCDDAAMGTAYQEVEIGA